MAKTFLVTGAGGFIGSHLVEQLVKEGATVKAFVHYNSFNRWGWLDFLDDKTKKSVEAVPGDICDAKSVASAARGCDTILHLAALIGIPYSYTAPQSYVETNIKGTLNVLEAAKAASASVVHTSTSEIYGTAQTVPISELHPVNPQSPYAATKAAADFLALSYYRSFNLPVTVIRPFNTYGPRQSARAVIPTIITQILEGRGEIRLGSLTPTRDLTYVEDTARGFALAALSGKGAGEIINLGTRSEASIGKLAEIIAELAGSKIKIEADASRVRPEKSEVERLLADNSKALKLLGWKPAYNLEEGLAKTIEWFKLHRQLYKAGIYNI